MLGKESKGEILKYSIRKPLTFLIAIGLVFTGAPYAEAANPSPKNVLVAALDTKCDHQRLWWGTPDFVDPSEWSSTSPGVKGKTFYYKYKNIFAGEYAGKWSTFSVTMGSKSAVVKPVNASAKYEFGKKRNRCPSSVTVSYSFVKSWLAKQ